MYTNRNFLTDNRLHINYININYIFETIFLKMHNSVCNALRLKMVSKKSHNKILF